MVRGVPHPLWLQAKASANLEGKTLGQWITETIAAKLREQVVAKEQGGSSPTAGQMLAADSMDPPSALHVAKQFLKDELADGPMPSTYVHRDARQAGVVRPTLNRAKAALGVVTRRPERKGGCYYWELPPGSRSGSRLRRLLPWITKH